LDKVRKYIPLILSILLMVIPFILGRNPYIILLCCLIGIYIISASGLDLLFGYSGQISLGHAAFYAIGAYISAIASMRLGIPVFLAMFIGAFSAVLISILIALPSAKLVHHFLALVTLAFGEIIHLIVANANNLTGGFTGINFVPSPQIGNLIFDSNRKYYYIIYTAVILFLLLKQAIVKSKIGRTFIAIRENTHAANGLGINIMFYKVMAFAISAFFTGFAGALYAHFIGFISPETFTINHSILLLTMVLFGGMGSLSGPIIGAVVITILSESLQRTGSYQMLFYGLFILIVLLFMPKGIAGKLESVTKFLRKAVKSSAKN